MRKVLRLRLEKHQELRYGENPHQKGAFYLDPQSRDPLSFKNFTQLQGKEISFNNLLDAEAALLVLSRLGGKRPACVVIKHGNPCGAAYGSNEWEAFYKAWHQGDYEAAFGGIVALNRKIDEIADLILADNKFFEVLLVPEISERALKIFSKKKDLRILVNPALYNPQLPKELDFKKIRGGWLVQQIDRKEIQLKDLKVVTERKPTSTELRDLLFAWKICQSSKSNTITLVKDETLIANGVGQQKRVGCCEVALQIAEKLGKILRGAAAASDAFFPFPDGPEILIQAGISAIIQPGGALRDKEVIELCNRNQVAMVFTGFRVFRH